MSLALADLRNALAPLLDASSAATETPPPTS
jgi:hypothetical protein